VASSILPFTLQVNDSDSFVLPFLQTGFEFRKHRSNPKMTGVVIASENEEMLLEALEEDQHVTAEKEYLKKQERLFKNWKKLLNSLKIQERIQREYGEKQKAAAKAVTVPTQGRHDGGGDAAAAAAGKRSSSAGDDREEEGNEGEENLEAYHNMGPTEGGEMDQPGGGFMVD
jgi:hypothetical protein